jgi:hypothetical protein
MVVLTLVIGLMVVAFAGKYIKDTVQDAMTSGKKQTTEMGKELDTQLDITSVFPVAIGAKDATNPSLPYNGLCMSGSNNLCTLSSTSPAKARLVVEAKNSGKNPIRANQFWDLKVYINDVPATNATDWGISQDYNEAWKTGGTKNIVLKYNCEDIASMGGTLRVKVQPPAGTGGTAEISCEECCKRSPSFQTQCATKCK